MITLASLFVRTITTLFNTILGKLRTDTDSYPENNMPMNTMKDIRNNTEKRNPSNDPAWDFRTQTPSVLSIGGNVESPFQAFLERAMFDITDNDSAGNVVEFVEGLLSIVETCNRDSSHTPGGGARLRLRLTVQVEERWE